MAISTDFTMHSTLNLLIASSSPLQFLRLVYNVSMTSSSPLLTHPSPSPINRKLLPVRVHKTATMKMEPYHYSINNGIASSIAHHDVLVMQGAALRMVPGRPKFVLGFV